ncbi:MAG: hypothetical protein SGI92_15035, partial [Bryobacteraceae bacterium]|nr:hypothetical protein [Bryobacteraceae bacterium]
AELQSLRTKGVLKGADAGERCAAYVHIGYHARQPLPPVTLVAEQDGPLWYSSRMVRDEYMRQHRGAGTRFGDEKRPDQSPSRSPDSAPSRSPTHRQGDGPSSPSSSSIKTPPKPPKGGGVFLEFWHAYPRKVAKPAALKAWTRICVDDRLLGTMLAALERQVQSEQWRKDGGAYIPHPATWLNQHRWDDEVGPLPTLASPASSDGRCACGELGVVRANNDAWLCSRHREAA